MNQNGNVENTANWDITVNETAVNGVNYKDILGDGALCYDIEKKTLTAKERINYVLKVRAPETDVILNGGIGARSSFDDRTARRFECCRCTRCDRYQ